MGRDVAESWKGRRYRDGSGGVHQFASNWNFRIGISPSPGKIAKLFGEAAAEFADYRPAFMRMAPKIKDGIRRIISTQGGSLGVAWPGLKNPYYLARKARLGWAMTELVATGLLSLSIDTVSIGKRSLKVGTWVPYAKALQWGRKGRNQGRVFMALDDQARKDAADELNQEASNILDRLQRKIESER